MMVTLPSKNVGDVDTISTRLTDKYLQGLRIEWVKSKARAARWWEEVALLNEEMRRAVAFCHARSQWWRDLAQQDELEGAAEIREGRRAYALAHANAETRLANHWERRWEPLRVAAEEFMRNYLMLGALNDDNAENVDEGNAVDANEDNAANANGNNAANANEDNAANADEGNAANANDDAAAHVPDNMNAAPVPIVEIELEEEEDYADDYDFHADEY